MTTHQTETTVLLTRGNPVQRRSQERTDQILAATKALLLEMPAETITTTEIANRADIPVSSLYRYFPNVFSIFNALIEPIIEEQDRRISKIIENDADQLGWRESLFAIMAAIQASFAEHPYYRPMFPMIMARRELLGPKEKLVNGLVKQLSERWRHGGDGFSNGNPTIVAHFTTQICLAIETHLATLTGQREREEYFHQLTLNLESYLANFLTD